jgi:hypothetical protein
MMYPTLRLYQMKCHLAEITRCGSIRNFSLATCGDEPQKKSAAAVAASQHVIRTDWKKEEAEAIYHSPLMDLVFSAVSDNYRHFQRSKTRLID